MITLKCKKHPRYLGVLPPRCWCNGCWYVYSLTKGIRSHERESNLVEVVR